MATCRHRVAFSTIARWNGEKPVRSNVVKSQPEYDERRKRRRRRGKERKEGGEREEGREGGGREGGGGERIGEGGREGRAKIK